MFRITTERWVPGMYAEVHLHLATHMNVLSVPVDAVDGLGTTVQHVYVVRDGELHLAKVTIGLQTATQVEILSGVQNGDQVVVGSTQRDYRTGRR